MSLFVIGSSNTDLVIYLDHIPKIGETIIGGESKVIFGGKGANQAVASKRAGADIKFITQLGNDTFGENLKIYFKNLDFDEKYILTDNNNHSGIAHIFVSKKGENSIAVAAGSNGTLTFEKIEPFLNDIAKASLVLIQFEIPLQTILSIVNFCSKKGVKVIVNPAPAIKLSKKIFKKIWMITPNETELELLTGISITNEKSVLEAAKIILSQGVEHCLVTLGEKGSIWINSKGCTRFKVPKQNAVDSTAAGDVFNGYLAYGITKGFSIRDSILLSHAAATISVTVKGAQTSIPSMKKTQLFLKKNNFEEQTVAI
ncbi:MAG: ribokinase [Flavobacteriaceae bacterium]|nr:ribokinase [Flavobacteriaceae bacterium]|tara:strand:+ start:485 stop:1426 length:942 start_codon:yes stop_codon:yes gene_type:complete